MGHCTRPRPSQASKILATEMVPEYVYNFETPYASLARFLSSV